MESNYSNFQSKKVNVRFDEGRLWRGHLGVVLLAMEQTVDMDVLKLNALRAVGAKKIAIATPYLDEVNAVEGKYIENEGFTITNLQGMNLTNDTDIVLTSTDFIKEFAMGINTPDADAVFISCGALRSVDVIDELEKALNKPVITSNQAFTWDLLRSAGFNDQFDGYGVLFREY